MYRGLTATVSPLFNNICWGIQWINKILLKNMILEANHNPTKSEKIEFNHDLMILPTAIIRYVGFTTE